MATGELYGVISPSLLELDHIPDVTALATYKESPDLRYTLVTYRAPVSLGQQRSTHSALPSASSYGKLPSAQFVDVAVSQVAQRSPVHHCSLVIRRVKPSQTLECISTMHGEIGPSQAAILNTHTAS